MTVVFRQRSTVVVKIKQNTQKVTANGAVALLVVISTCLSYVNVTSRI